MALSSKDLPLKVQREIAAQRAKAGAGDAIPKPGKRGKAKPLNEGWDSQEERRYYQRHLVLLEKAGEISNLRRQVRVDLHIGQRYMRLDFAYYDHHLDCEVWEDWKGAGWKKNNWFKDWKLKADMWAAGLGPGLLRITTPRSGGYHHEDIHPRSNPEAVKRMLANANPQEQSQ